MNDTVIILANLGSPKSPKPQDVRTYLNEFLMDKYVIDLPYLLRKLIVSAFILPTRPKKSAHAYQAIWTQQGSPLIHISKQATKELKKQLNIPIYLAMRYGEPSIKSIYQYITDHHPNAKRIVLFPLYPQFAMSTVTTIIEKTKKIIGKNINLTIVPPFYNNPMYIDALVASASEYLQQDYDHLLFSYHGLPERHLKKTDPTKNHCLIKPNCCHENSIAHDTCYRAQCFKTTAAFVETLQIPKNKYSIAFQSRLGKAQWLEPYTDMELVRLAESGIKKLLVICPAFVTDCLETLEEIGIRGKETFLEAGGESLTLIPCLNTNINWIKALTHICNQFSK